MDNGVLDNEEDEDASSEYAPDEDGYVDLGLNDEETKTLFDLSWRCLHGVVLYLRTIVVTCLL